MDRDAGSACIQAEPACNHSFDSRSKVTGPSRPDGSSGEFALYEFHVSNVYFFVTPGC